MGFSVGVGVAGSGVGDGITILSPGLRRVGMGELEGSTIPTGWVDSGGCWEPLLIWLASKAPAATIAAPAANTTIFLPAWPFFGALMSGVPLPPKGESTEGCPAVLFILSFRAILLNHKTVEYFEYILDDPQLVRGREAPTGRALRDGHRASMAHRLPRCHVFQHRG